MSSKTEGVLIVGPMQGRKNEFGAEIAPDFARAKKQILTRAPRVLVIGTGVGKSFDSFCQWTLENSPETLWIVASQDLPPLKIMQWNNSGKIFDLIDDLDDETLEAKLRAALEAAGTTEQEHDLARMFNEKSQELTKLSGDLENRVERRQKTLRRSLTTLESTKTRLESFHKALLGIHRASSVVQMEKTLSEALAESINMVWVRVRFHSQSLLKQQSGPNILAIEIPFTRDNLRGEVFFAKKEDAKFSPDEIDFLHELSEALGLALSRLHKLEQAEIVKAQWQATFDAIPHPLCLTSSDGEILKLNRAFQQACSALGFRQLIGQNCFKCFFGADFHAPVPLGDSFTFRSTRSNPENETYEVAGQTLGMAVDGQTVRLILLRSISEELRYERRILEASKLAELGTIGSSIAHELNNPLGGMLSFLQLILMDLKPGEGIQPEVKQMESAVLRCRDIVQNLLSFSRKQDLGEFTEIDLWDVVEKSVKLIELQSKSKGILIELPEKHSAKVVGSANALSQALCNLLQNSIDAISEKIKEDPRFPGKITLALSARNHDFQLTLADNGPGIKPEFHSQVFNPRFTTRDPEIYSGMGLTTAFTIVSEHHGSLEILTPTGAGTTAVLTLHEASVASEKRH